MSTLPPGSRDKIPKGWSYPLKRSALDAAIVAANLTSVASVYFVFRSHGSIFLSVMYTGEQHRQQRGAGTCSVWIYSVPSQTRKAYESAILSALLPAMTRWIEKLEQAGNVRRAVDHQWNAHMSDAGPVVTGH